MTQCLRPLAPTDEELLRHALDGEKLSIAAKEHLEQCPFCQQRLAEYASTNSLILSHLYRSQCPDATMLSHYCIGILSMDEAMGVTSHLELCPLCTNEVAEIRLLLTTFEPFPQENLSAPSATSHIIASPIPWQPIIWNGSDSTRDQSWPRQYQTDTISISLHLARDKQGILLLLGQLSTRNGIEHIEILAGAKVELYVAHDSSSFPTREYVPDFNSTDVQGPLLSTQVDDFGHIVFKSVSPGFYLMIIYLPETEVVIEEINVHFS